MTAVVYATISSYRDRRIVESTRLMLRKPGASVRLVVVLQDDDPSITHALEQLGAEVVPLPTRAARGPSWARAIGQSMWMGEPWYYMCDAHTRLQDGWASAMIAECQAAQELTGRPPVMSGYCHEEGKLDIDQALIVAITRWRRAGVAKRGWTFPRTWFRGQPAIGRILSAHHLMAPGRWCDEVPYDPRGYFGTEEFTMTIRSWTAGYDLWHPSISVAEHSYRYGVEGEYHNRHQSDDPAWLKLRRQADERAWALYAGDCKLGAFGPGRDRTVKQYSEWAGIDFDRRTVMDERQWRNGAGRLS